MIEEHDSTPFVVTLGETMVALVAEEAGPLRYASRFQRRPAGAGGTVSFDVNFRRQLGVHDPEAAFGPFIHIAHFLFLAWTRPSNFSGRKTARPSRELVSLDRPAVIPATSNR